MTQFNIGIDMGGVLTIHDNKNNETINNEHKNTKVNMPYAVDSLYELKELNHNLFLVSYCGKNRARDTRNSLAIEKIDTLFEHQYYVKNKLFKSQICNNIGCHFMIDDNVHVLDNIKKHNNNIVTILFEGNNHRVHKCAKDWKQVVNIIKNTKYFEPIKDSFNIDDLLC